MMPLAIGPSPLLAAGLDWLEALLPILFILFWILSQVVAVVKKVSGGSEPAKPAPPPVRRPRPVADREVGKDIHDEIREFLRRETPDRRPAPPSVSAKSGPAGPRPALQLAGQPRSVSLSTLQRVSGESIAEKVKEDFAKELDHLSTPLTADRALGSLQPVAAEAAVAPAAGIVRSLRSPATLRDLVVIREILDRPVDRW